MSRPNGKSIQACVHTSWQPVLACKSRTIDIQGLTCTVCLQFSPEENKHTKLAEKHNTESTGRWVLILTTDQNRSVCSKPFSRTHRGLTLMLFPQNQSTEYPFSNLFNLSFLEIMLKCLPNCLSPVCLSFLHNMRGWGE